MEFVPLFTSKSVDFAWFLYCIRHISMNERGTEFSNRLFTTYFVLSFHFIICAFPYFCFIYSQKSFPHPISNLCLIMNASLNLLLFTSCNKFLTLPCIRCLVLDWYELVLIPLLCSMLLPHFDNKEYKHWLTLIHESLKVVFFTVWKQTFSRSKTFQGSFYRYYIHWALIIFTAFQIDA